jgi:hypothetical protein
MKMISTRRSFGQFYLSQGYAGKRISTNDCGPTCAAMVLNILMAQNKKPGRKVTKKDVIQRVPLYGRLPGWIPFIGGATAPWGLTAAFNRLAGEKKISWEARRISAASRGQIVGLLKKGDLISFLRFWKGGGAHWTNIVSLTEDGQRLLFLDPDPRLGKKANSAKVIVMDFSAIQADWQRQPWWAAFLGLIREIVVYSEKSQPE